MFTGALSPKINHFYAVEFRNESCKSESLPSNHLTKEDQFVTFCRFYFAFISSLRVATKNLDWKKRSFSSSWASNENGDERRKKTVQGKWGKGENKGCYWTLNRSNNRVTIYGSEPAKIVLRWSFFWNPAYSKFITSIVVLTCHYRVLDAFGKHFQATVHFSLSSAIDKAQQHW